MKKPLLATAVAATLATATVTAPAALADDGGGVSSGQESSSPSSSSDSGSLSPGAIAGITIGVIAAVGAGGYLALQQGLVTLPPQAAGFLRQIGLPAGPQAPAKPAPSGKRGSCAASEFDRLVPGWPHFTGTVVNYCDGKWAVASANRTDWMVRFHFDGNRWTVLPRDGVKQTGMAQSCFNGIKLRNQGAPEAFIRQVPICTPAEIGTTY